MEPAIHPQLHVIFGLIRSVFDIVTFVTLRVGSGANEPCSGQGWFIDSTITELAVMLVLRTNRRFYRSRPDRAPLLSSIAIAAITIALPYSPLATPLGLTTVPPESSAPSSDSPPSTSLLSNWQNADSHPPIEDESPTDHLNRSRSQPVGA